jgi:hypothetical protein
MVLKRKPPAEFEAPQETAVQEPADTAPPESAPWTEEDAAAAGGAATATAAAPAKTVAPAKTTAVVTAPKQGGLVASNSPKVNPNCIKEQKQP